jgi:hypothetical protein
MRHLNVLLVGKGFEQARTTLARLAEFGCRYQCASSLPEADCLVREQRFDLVLNGIYVDSHEICSLREALRGAPTTLLYAYEVEDGFWWILGLDRGRPCLGDVPAIPSSQFLRALDLVLAGIQSDGMALPKILTWLCSPEPRLPEVISSRTAVRQPQVLRAVAH